MWFLAHCRKQTACDGPRLSRTEVRYNIPVFYGLVSRCLPVSGNTIVTCTK